MQTTEPSGSAIALGVVVVLLLLGAPVGFLLNAIRSDPGRPRVALLESSTSTTDTRAEVCARDPGANHAFTAIESKIFRGSDLGCATFANSELRHVTFEKTRVSEADFRRAILEGVVFRDVIAAFSMFDQAVLRDVKFVDVNLRGSTFLDARIGSVTFVRTTCPDGAFSDDSGKTCVGHRFGGPQ